MHWLSPDRKLCPPVDHVQRLQLAPSVHDAHLTQVASNIAVSQIECQMYPGEMFIHDVRLGKTPFILDGFAVQSLEHRLRHCLKHARSIQWCVQCQPGPGNPSAEKSALRRSAFSKTEPSNPSLIQGMHGVRAPPSIIGQSPLLSW